MWYSIYFVQVASNRGHITLNLYEKMQYLPRYLDIFYTYISYLSESIRSARKNKSDILFVPTPERHYNIYYLVI